MPVIEVSPEAEGEDPLKPASADRLRGGARRFCEVYTAAGAMVTEWGGGTVFGAKEVEKASSPDESASHEKYKSRPAAGLTFYIPVQGSIATAALDTFAGSCHFMSHAQDGSLRSAAVTLIRE